MLLKAWQCPIQPKPLELEIQRKIKLRNDEFPTLIAQLTKQTKSFLSNLR